MQGENFDARDGLRGMMAVERMRERAQSLEREKAQAL